MTTVFSIVLPVRVDCRDRLDNLKAVLSWIDTIGCPVILLEADQTPRLKSVVTLYKHVRYYFVEDKNKAFHRTKYINDLLRLTDADIVAVWDADAIVPHLQVKEAITCMNRLKTTIVYPYNGIVYMLSSQQSAEFRKQQDLLPFCNEKMETLMGRIACGCVYMVNRIRYLSLGGDNEKFVGWGPEDAERLHRVQIAGDEVRWLSSGPLFHLHHVRNDRKDKNFQKNLLSMQKEFVRVCSFNQSEMWNYIHDELLTLSIK